MSVLRAAIAERKRVGRDLAIGLTFVLLSWAALIWYAVISGSVRRGEVAWDLGLYVRVAEHWLATGQAYYPVQYAGTYTNAGDVNLYPPLALYLFVPFTVLPAVLWWAVPVTIYVATLAHFRPAWWAWPYLAFVVGTVAFASAIVHGNSGMWTLAVLCLAMRWPVGGAALALKPTELLFALPLIRRRGFWVGLGAVALLALPLGGLWLDWATALANYRGETVLYAMQGWSVTIAPWVVMLAATRRPAGAPENSDDRLRR
jgi:hypothetical protein